MICNSRWNVDCGRHCTCIASWWGWQHFWWSSLGIQSCQCLEGWCCKSSWDPAQRTVDCVMTKSATQKLIAGLIYVLVEDCLAIWCAQNLRNRQEMYILGWWSQSNLERIHVMDELMNTYTHYTSILFINNCQKHSKSKCSEHRESLKTFISKVFKSCTEHHTLLVSIKGEQSFCSSASILYQSVVCGQTSVVLPL